MKFGRRTTDDGLGQRCGWWTSVSIFLALFLLSTVYASDALARRRMAGAAIKPAHEWFLVLDRDTRAALGPVDGHRVLKIRLDRVAGAPEEGSAGEAYEAVPRPERITVCVLERICETIRLAPEGAMELKSTEIDFSQRLAEEAVPPDAKLFLLVYRDRPANSGSITVSLKAETENTMELPRFTPI